MEIKNPLSYKTSQLLLLEQDAAVTLSLLYLPPNFNTEMNSLPHFNCRKANKSWPLQGAALPRRCRSRVAPAAAAAHAPTGAGRGSRAAPSAARPVI